MLEKSGNNSANPSMIVKLSFVLRTNLSSFVTTRVSIGPNLDSNSWNRVLSKLVPVNFSE